jgi:hypothetical protein
MDLPIHHDCDERADLRADFEGKMFMRSGTIIPHAKMFETTLSYTKTYSYNL